MISFSPEVAARLRSSDDRIVVTGVGGWLGTATLEMLDSALQDEFVSRVAAYASSARPMRLTSGRTISVYPLEELLKREERRRTYVLHYAYLGKEKVAQLGELRFTAINAAINDLVEEYCSTIPEGGLFFASSGAARYATGSTEDASREPYGAAKVRDEARFLRQRRPGFVVSVCRIFNMAGPYINKLSDYALSSILLDILRGGPVTIRADRRVLRSFTHVRDIVEIIVHTLLEDNAPQNVFDTAGTEIIEIGDLARRAALLLGAEGIAVDRPALAPGAEDLYAGDPTAFHNLVKNMGMQLAGIDKQILDTAQFLRGCPV